MIDKDPALGQYIGASSLVNAESIAVSTVQEREARSMKKKVVGIVPSARLFENEDLYEDQYTFVNNYALRVADMWWASSSIRRWTGAWTVYSGF